MPGGPSVRFSGMRMALASYRSSMVTPGARARARAVRGVMLPGSARPGEPGGVPELAEAGRPCPAHADDRRPPFCREGAPAFRRGEDVRRSSDPWSRMRGLYNIVRFFRPFLYACMHLYASRDAYKKGLGKARKPLYIKEKTEFLSLVCIVCINIRGFLPFSRILYKGMMHTMHTRPRTIPGTLEPSRNGEKRCMHPRMHTDAYRPAGMHTGPMAGPSPSGVATATLREGMAGFSTTARNGVSRITRTSNPSPASMSSIALTSPSSMRSPDPFRRAPRGSRSVEPHARTLQHCEVLPAVLYACMHLYASGDAYKKGLGKARKPLYIKEKTEFLSLVCIVCINIRGFFPFLESSIRE